MREEKLRVACHMKTYDAKAPARAFVSKAFFLPRGAGQFSAVLAPGASGHRLFALKLQRGCRCAAQLGYARLVLHVRRDVVDPASLVCGRARGDE